MTVAHGLWLINFVLVLLALVLARDVVGLRGQRGRDVRRRFLKEFVRRVELLPSLDALRDAWSAILSQPDVVVDMNDAQISAICALERAADSAVSRLREAAAPNVNLLNDVAEFVDHGLVRPKDIARSYPDLHYVLLRHLALISPFIWYESILQGRGRWGYRTVRLKTIFEQLRVISPRKRIRQTLVLEINDVYFMALPEVGQVRRAWGSFRLLVRSPTINVRSKLAQVRERDEMESRLTAAGVNVSRGTDPGSVVDW